MYKRGFTLIELLVVIAIIGILSSVVMVGLSDVRKSGRDAKRVADIKSIQVALQLYYVDQNQFPAILSSLVPIYISNVPTDPSTNNAYYYTAIHLGPTNSTNCTLNVPVRYHLGAALETSNASLLGQDADWIDLDGAEPLTNYGICSGTGARFHGQATQCAGTSAGTENCYDVTN